MLPVESEEEYAKRVEAEAAAAGKKTGELAAREIGRSFGDAFESVILKDKPFRSVFRTLIQDIHSTILQSVVESSVTALIGHGRNGDQVSHLFETLVKAFTFADGGVMGPHGPLPLQTYARGGVADSPQVALFGEGRTPEAFVPLPDGRRIPVRMEGAGTEPRGVSVVNNITVHAADAGSFRRAEGQIGAEIAGRLQRHLSRNG